jgi:hypothetical protein
MSGNIANKKTVLDAASIRLDQLDVALTKFDSLGEQQIKLQADLKIAQAQEETILSNELLSHDAGATQLAQCRALLDVVKRRLENVTQKLAEGQRAVFDAGSQAMEAAFSVWAKLRENREERAKAVFAEHFTLPSHWPVPVREIWENSVWVKQVNSLQHDFQLQPGHSIEASLDRLRTLRGRFDSLRRLIEQEPNLDLQSIAKAPALSVVSRAA